MVRTPCRRYPAMIVAAAILTLSGCTGVKQYFDNGLKVGPNYCPPTAEVAPHWLDEADVRVRSNGDPPCQWWTVFNDDVLNGLIECTASQNLTLREAGMRILTARDELAIVRGNIFPQQQGAQGAFRRIGVPASQVSTGEFGGLVLPTDPPFTVPQTIDFPASFAERWRLGVGLSWELDFWGRFRRAIASAEDTLDASVANYDDVLVTLLADVAGEYVDLRQQQRRISLLRANVDLQRETLKIAQRRFDEGATSELDVLQVATTLAQTESGIPRLQSALRHSFNRLCILLGVPPYDLEKRLGESPIPEAPKDVIVGIPADLLRRRPDVRRAERLAAAQGEKIGIAQADLYPALSVTGALSWGTDTFSHLLTNNAFNGSVGPSFQWNLLNYGRITSNVQLQRDEFQRLVTLYQNAVLQANREAEDGIVEFLRAQEAAALLDDSVVKAKKAADIVLRKYKAGQVDGNRVVEIQQTLVSQQDQQAALHGVIAVGLIQVYRALGGGWETPIAHRTPDEIPSPAPATNEAPLPKMPTLSTVPASKEPKK